MVSSEEPKVRLYHIPLQLKTALAWALFIHIALGA